MVVDDGTRLWYRSTGSGSEAVVVPCCGNADDFGRLVTPGRRVVFYDVRNRGRSSTVADPARLGFDREVADLEQLCDHLGIGSASLVGWSYHAGVITRFALDHPERVGRLVVAAAIPPRSGIQPTEAAPPAPHQLAHLDQLQAEGVPEADPARWCREWRQVYVPRQMGRPEAFERLTSPCDLDNEQPRHVAVAMIFVLASLGDYDWRGELRMLRAPLLVVHGTADADPVELASEWVDAVPDGRLLAIEGVGQLPWAEAPDQFFGTVNRFLAGEPV